MTKATATYQGKQIEARQGDDMKYRAYVKEPGCAKFKLIEGIKASPYARKVVNWAVEALQEDDRQSNLYREILQQEQLRNAYLEE